jgi:hypothetical protein
VATFNLYPSSRGSDIGGSAIQVLDHAPCIGRPSGASLSAWTNCMARDSVPLGMA